MGGGRRTALLLLAVAAAAAGQAAAEQFGDGAALCSAGALHDQANQGTVLCAATSKPTCAGTVKIDNAEDCCKLCGTTTGCVWWVYNSGGSMEPDCKVYSKKGLNTASLPPQGEVVSGPLVRGAGPVDGPKGLGWGVFFLVVFFGGGVLYFVGGFVAKKKLPHAEFWREFPALVIEGISFTMGRGGGGEGKEPLFEDVSEDGDEEDGGRRRSKKDKKDKKKDSKDSKSAKGGKSEKSSSKDKARDRRKSAPALEDRKSSKGSKKDKERSSRKSTPGVVEGAPPVEAAETADGKPPARKFKPSVYRGDEWQAPKPQLSTGDRITAGARVAQTM